MCSFLLICILYEDFIIIITIATIESCNSIVYNSCSKIKDKGKEGGKSIQV